MLLCKKKQLYFRVYIIQATLVVESRSPPNPLRKKNSYPPHCNDSDLLAATQDAIARGGATQHLELHQERSLLLFFFLSTRLFTGQTETSIHPSSGFDFVNPLRLSNFYFFTAIIFAASPRDNSLSTTRYPLDDIIRQR